MVLNAVCVSKHGPIAFSDCNIVIFLQDELSVLFVASRQKRGVRDFCRPAISNEQVFIVQPTQGHPTVPPPFTHFYSLLLVIKEEITKSLLDIPSLHNANNDVWRYLNVIARTPHSPKARCRLADSRLCRLQPSVLSLYTVRYN
jgi:hypothetical protein